MTPRLCEATYVDGYRIMLRYEDGTEGVVDLEAQLWGEVFEPLRDIRQFRAFKVDTQLQTITWATGADLAPEFLYAEASRAA